MEDSISVLPTDENPSSVDEQYIINAIMKVPLDSNVDVVENDNDNDNGNDNDNDNDNETQPKKITVNSNIEYYITLFKLNIKLIAIMILLFYSCNSVYFETHVLNVLKFNPDNYNLSKAVFFGLCFFILLVFGVI